MDYTAGSFPVTTVDPELDTPVEPHEFYNHEDEAFYNICESHAVALSKVWWQTCSITLSSDKPELFENAPVGLQLIGKTQEEEAVIAMTEIVDNALRRYKDSR